MKLSLSLLIVPLLASAWATGITTGCNADNCLRALRNPISTAAATSFCHSYNQANVTAAMSVPPQLATACGSGPTQVSRLSSACSCYAPGPACNNTSSDSSNCGACGNLCITGSTCSSGACICTNSGKPPCNGQCPDLASDNNNCGGCGHSCSTGTTCQSGTCAPIPGNVTCSSYAASCSDVMKGILASNSIASPQLVDYRIQSAIMGITTPIDFLAALGPNPCQIYTDPTEHSSCMELLANSLFIAQLTDITKGALSSFQTCASEFAMGGPDYQIIINEPNNATCIGHNGTRRQEKRTFGFGKDYDLTRSVLEGIEYYRSTPLLGPWKSSDLQLVREQLSTCSQTGNCFQTCPDCRYQQTYCGTQANTISGAVCATVGIATNAAVGTLVGGVCAAACGPAALFCAGFCSRFAGALAGLVVGTECLGMRAGICDPLTQRCANCNSANNGLCNPSSTQCCAGETGTQCGAGCCCCPTCQAPGGVNCACTAAPC